MTKTNKTLMTAALGGLMLAAKISSASADDTHAAAPAAGEKMGQCNGINSCKGTSACHTESTTCAGKNSCKGKGWIKATKADCEAKGGKFSE